tara:strand:+ start:2952 stop:4040 length:1089 start_codon:yes stop_codon:yes gene_type:complete
MNHFCMAPFVHIQRNSYGEFNPCCMFSTRIYSEYDSIQDAFNGKENRILRQKMLNDEKIPGCDKCYRDESLGKSSYRQRFNSRYDEQYINNPTIKELELALGNKCNYKCVDCNTKYSTSWYDDDILLNRTYNTFKGREVINKIYDSDFEIMDLNEIKILGGEPFLEKRYIDLFKKINAENINLFFVTNNSIFPNEEWLTQLKRFKSINFNISIDGVYDVAEFVRYGTKFSKYEKNYKRWLDLNLSNMSVIPHFVFHSLNVLNFDQTIEWLAKIYDHKIEKILNYISYDFLSMPEMLNCSFLTDNCKHNILSNVSYFKNELSNFFDTNEFNSKNIADLQKYFSFLNMRSEIPEQSHQIIKWLK